MVDTRLKGFVTTTIDFMDMKIDGNDLNQSHVWESHVWYPSVLHSFVFSLERARFLPMTINKIYDHQRALTNQKGYF
jgi:hypothetical protein